MPHAPLHPQVSKFKDCTGVKVFSSWYPVLVSGLSTYCRFFCCHLTQISFLGSLLIMTPARISDNADVAAPPSSKTTGKVASNGSSGNKATHFGSMNTSLIESKFLSHPDELGVVAVGFSGGQVCCSWLLLCLLRVSGPY